jgi:hypothetical protein
MKRLARNNFRCALAYWIKNGRRCDHGEHPELEGEARLMVWPSWGPWWPGVFGDLGEGEVRACTECGVMEKRAANHDTLEGSNS